jgi:hypothetical protein
MKPIDPTPYVAVYGLLMFLVPWLIFGSYIIRGLVYARGKGICLFSLTGGAEIRALRQTDSHAAFLHRRSLRWLVITLALWIVGFALLGLTLFFPHRTGTV